MGREDSGSVVAVKVEKPVLPSCDGFSGQRARWSWRALDERRWLAGWSLLRFVSDELTAEHPRQGAPALSGSLAGRGTWVLG